MLIYKHKALTECSSGKYYFYWCDRGERGASAAPDFYRNHALRLPFRPAADCGPDE